MGECSWTNLGSCITEQLYESLVNGLSAGIQPFLDYIRELLVAQPNTDLFASMHASIVYMLSLFYALLLLYTGFHFITSGYDVEKREHAKEWLKNIIIMIVLVQSSYFFYTAALDLTTTLTNIFYSKIDPHFFMMTADNFFNIILQSLSYLFYNVLLVITIIMLVIRYCLASVGIVLFPIGIFLYFVPPVKSYGSMIISYLFANMFVSIPITIMFVAFSILLSWALT